MKVFDYDNLILGEKIFGLELLDSTVKVLELKRVRGKFAVVGFGEGAINKGSTSNGVIVDPKAVAGVIEEARDKARPRRIRSRYTSVVLPDAKIFVRVIKFPAGMTKEEIREAVEWKAKDLIAMPLEKVYWDWHRLTYNGSDKYPQAEIEVVISAVERECADSYTQTLKLLNITPLYYDISGNAIARFLFQNDYKKKQALLVRVDQYATTLSLFLRGGVRYQTIMKEYIKGGYGALIDVASSKLGLDPVQAEKLILAPKSLNNDQKAILKETYMIKYKGLQTEISQILDFYKQTVIQGNGKPQELDGIFLYGKGATIFEAKELCGDDEMKFPVSPPETTSISPVLQFISRAPLFENFVILGLSLRNLGLFRELRDINLVPRSIKEKYLQVSIYSNLYTYLRIIFWNTFLIALTLAFSYLITLLYQANVEQELTAVQNVAESRAIQQLQHDILYVNQTVGQLEALVDTQFNWDIFFYEVSQRRNAGIQYDNLLITEDENDWKAISGEKKVAQKQGYMYLIISGTAGTRENLQDYVKNMEESDLFVDVKMPISNFELSSDINFTLYCLVDITGLQQAQE